MVSVLSSVSHRQNTIVCVHEDTLAIEKEMKTVSEKILKSRGHGCEENILRVNTPF